MWASPDTVTPLVGPRALASLFDQVGHQIQYWKCFTSFMCQGLGGSGSQNVEVHSMLETQSDQSKCGDICFGLSSASHPVHTRLGMMTWKTPPTSTTSWSSLRISTGRCIKFFFMHLCCFVFYFLGLLSCYH